MTFRRLRRLRSFSPSQVEGRLQTLQLRASKPLFDFHPSKAASKLFVTKVPLRGILPEPSFFLDSGTSFSKPHAILNFIFFVRVKKKTFVFFLVKDCFICKTLHFAFYLNFLICTIFLNLLMCACLACLFLFCSFKIRPEALRVAFSLLCVEII